MKMPFRDGNRQQTDVLIIDDVSILSGKLLESIEIYSYASEK